MKKSVMTKGQVCGNAEEKKHGEDVVRGSDRIAASLFHKKNGKLVLENGSEYKGTLFGKIGCSGGEVVFNTGMTGYQEILTDPSYYGQIVTMTYPLIGNYGVNLTDLESEKPWVKGFIVGERCPGASNFRAELELEHYLESHGIVGLEGVDTRALAKELREHGSMKGRILAEGQVLPKGEEYEKLAVYEVTTPTSYDRGCSKVTMEGNGAEGKKIAVMDFGVKQSILKEWQKRGCQLTVFPASATADEILEIKPDLVFLSNGPGDPAELSEIVEQIKRLIQVKPVVGICLGHQLLALSMGGTTKKLKYGHRGCNHPVKDLGKDRVFITSQNHGYYVDHLPEGMEATHISMNDGTVEGMRHRKGRIFSVQFHPEASPGPEENSYLFDEFLKYAD